MTIETHSFQTEVQQLMNLMIHSLYSNKEIFLRELISNASDALDKVRFEEITNKDLLKSEKELSINLKAIKDHNLIVLEDNGIGMTRDELIHNLGTIANSGTKKFLEKLSESDKKDAQLIGQFGVGFYSVFMVAEKIVVSSRSAVGGTGYTWTSNGQGSYTLEENDKQDRGTRIEIYLKDSEKEFADDWKLRSIVHKYSDYVVYPVYLEERKEDPETKEVKEEQTRLNKSTPVWARNKRENKDEDYIELYKQISMDWNDPLLWEHIKVEGLVPFNSVVFIPSQAPFDLYTRDNHGLHLYVKRVSIMEKCKELLPEYLRFVAGVVETDDLPLNVSREILQQNNKLPQIKKQIVKKILTALQNLASNDAEKYSAFYKIFGAVLKEGFHFDFEQHEALSELVRFRSSKTGSDSWVSFKEYSERMVTGQKDIYYLTGPNYESVEKSPHLESLTARGIEVLFLTDPIDEWVLMSFSKYKDHSLKSINKGDLDLEGVGSQLNENQEKPEETQTTEISSLLDSFKSRLSEQVKDVKISKRLKESPCCLVADESGMSAHMERMMRATGQAVPVSKRILEINPTHPLIKNLAHKTAQANEAPVMDEWVDVLYDMALLAEGSPVKNPGVFAKQVAKIMQIASAR